MKFIFFAHPEFIHSQSMPRYAKMLADGMKNRGHEVETWQPKPFFYKLIAHRSISKWLGYIDQYLVFPMNVRKRIRRLPAETIFVFTDHALGPWVPLTRKRLHVIHCHDFLAQRSAFGEFIENPISFTGRIYQAYIRSGYTKGKNFISISCKTKEDLHRFLPADPEISEVIHNGLNQDFEKQDNEEAKKILSKETGINLSAGYILHVGGNQWYKNRTGVIEIFNAFQSENNSPEQLIMIGEKPSQELNACYNASPFKNKIHFLTSVEDKLLRTAYAGACVFLFPSIAEGFGWPIAEAMAAGCPVITTGEAPMTEVAGDCAYLIEGRPANTSKLNEWAINSAKVVMQTIQLSIKDRNDNIKRGKVNIARFDPDIALNKIEQLYVRIHSNRKIK